MYQALLDSGAAVNLIHEDVVRHLSLEASETPEPLQILTANGKTLSIATRQVTIRYTIANVPHEDTFVVAPIGTHSLILGMPFLERTDALVKWKERTVHFPPALKPADDSQVATSKPNRSAKRKRQNSRRKQQPVMATPEPTPSPSPSKDEPTIKIVPFHALHLEKGEQVYLINVNPSPVPTPLNSSPVTSSEELAIRRREALANLPSEYHDYVESVFGEVEPAQALPPHRGHVDHRIDLVDGSSPVFGPIYNLSETELKTLKEYIETSIAKGIIRPSKSPFGSPVLFTKKPDGSLRMCVDYRALNRMTIKNRYPLPLISELLDRLRQAKYFTKIDLLSAFYQLRIAQGEEWKTAFRTRYGHFEYLVMPFGLTNAPASFQAYINDILREFLDQFCVAYLDDILIYSDTYEEHVQHVRVVLEKLQKVGLHARADKCTFHQRSISFLGYIVSSEGISMDPERISTITEWPVPESVHDVQVFLGLANYYRRFIEGYSRIVLPLTNLLRKDLPFKWSPEAQTAFDAIKVTYTSAPVLCHFNPTLPIQLHTDSSGFALSGILSQLHDNRWHPVAFWSRKCLPTECNYDIHDREMLAIVESMKHWHHYLEGSRHSVQVLSDHRNLEVFMSTKVLNRRQARWAELLANYDFVLVHIPGKNNPTDAPSRRPDYTKGVDLPSGALIPPKALRLLKPLLPSPLPPPQAEGIPETPILLGNLVGLQTDLGISQDLCDEILSGLESDPLALKLKNEPMHPWSWKDGYLLHDGLLYLPDVNNLCLRMVRNHHDTALAGHPGTTKTVELLSRNYYFPGMYKYIKKYVTSCDLCSRAKPPRHQRAGELAPIPVPDTPWKGISCDFIVDLPESNSYDALLVFVDCLTKMCHLIPCNKTTDAPQFAQLFLERVVALHGLPDSLVSDRGSVFTSRFWKSLSTLLGINPRLSTAFHPQTDGQTERMNQIVEQYLRIYCNHQQDDWSRLLPLAEFSINNSYQESIKTSPFYANYGYHPRFTIMVSAPNPSTSVAPAAQDLAEKLKALHERLVESVKSAQNTQAKYYDAKRKRTVFDVGDKVWLKSLNLRTERPSKKLDWKHIGPFVITEKIGLQAYRLQLPTSMNVHPVFHVTLLEPYHENTIPDRVQPPPPPVTINEETEYEVEEVIDSKISRRKLMYLVKWKGYPISDNS